MQYVSSFFGLGGSSPANPNVFLFDSREEPNTKVTDLTAANLLAKRARSVLSFNGFCNVVRGRKSGKHYFCPLKYTRPRANLIDANTDIVSQPSDGNLSGMTAVAASQTYMLSLGTDTSLFLTHGVKTTSELSDARMFFPPIVLSDTNCPYGQGGTARIGFRYIHDGGNQFNATADVSMSVPACRSATGTPIFSGPVVASKLMQAAISTSVSGGSYGTPALDTTSFDGLIYQVQANLPDESPILNRAMCYLKELRGFVLLDSNDFDEIAAIPGTRPKIRFKETKLRI